MAEPDSTTIARESARLAAASVHVAYPATIVSYDSASQKATVRIAPCFRRKDPAQGNAVVTYRPPDIPGVPVAFPGAGEYSDTWPLVAGNSGLLIVVSRSMDEWLSQGGTTSEPQDPRRHDLTDSVFLPGLRSFAASEVVPAAGVHASARVIRAPLLLLGDSTATAFVALATLVLDRLTAIVNGFNTHTHTTSTGASGPPNTPLATPASVAATKVKAV